MFRRAIPVSVFLLGVLLILRGMSFVPLFESGFGTWQLLPLPEQKRRGNSQVMRSHHVPFQGGYSRTTARKQNMTKTTKILLIEAIAAFGLGFTDILWGVGKPIGAIFLGLFLISTVLEKEAAKFDEEETLRSNEAANAMQSAKNAGSEKQTVRLTAATAHSR
jgi:hypothetical protein